MALASQYRTFRATSNPQALSENASIHYVTSLVSVKGAATITKHLSVVARQVRKQQENVLSSIESGEALFQEIETKLEFLTNGGAYLPSLDDNLVVDQEATLPILHVVQFDANGKIQQIRLHWDQASLLKDVGVIGARGSNWPIKGGIEQCKLISSSTGYVPRSLEATTKQMGDVTITSRPTKKADFPQDPRATDDPFTTRGNQNDEQPTWNPKIATRGASRPADRPWGDLFVGGDSNEPTPTAKRSVSPSKENIAPKLGAGKNYRENRLFDIEEPQTVEAPKIGAGTNYRENRLFDLEEPAAGGGTGSPSKKDQVYMKPHPQKFNHFDLFDGHEEAAPTPSAPRPKTKHQSQWDFSDFVTPAKPVRSRGQSQGAHHFSFDDPTLEDSPMKKANPPKPRPDAESHFELHDDGGDPDATRSRPQASGVSGSSQHYRNQSSLWESQQDDGGVTPEEGTPEKRGRSAMTNPISQKDRGKDFNAHFVMTDDAAVGDANSAGPKPSAIGTNVKDRRKDFDAHWAIDDENPGAMDSKDDSSTRNTGLSRNKASALKTMSAQWEGRDDSPATDSNAPEDRIMHGAGVNQSTGIKSSGDGMGGRKGDARHWGFNDGEGEKVQATAPKGGPKNAGQRTEGAWGF